MDDHEIKAANRRLYDAIAKNYESIDGRRLPSLTKWLENNLKSIRESVSGGKILDIGSGSGFLLRCAKNYFEEKVALDIASKILAYNRKTFDFGVCAETDHLPFKDKSFDVVSSFAVLHHLGSYSGFVKEIFRVIKPGGIFYSDHDLDKNFYRRFGFLLNIYRKFNNTAKKYIDANKNITEKIYRLSEAHEKGIDSELIIDLLKNAGFSVYAFYHWYGLSPITDSVFGKSVWPKGWAPLVALRAKKL